MADGTGLAYCVGQRVAGDERSTTSHNLCPQKRQNVSSTTIIFLGLITDLDGALLDASRSSQQVPFAFVALCNRIKGIPKEVYLSHYHLVRQRTSQLAHRRATNR